MTLLTILAASAAPVTRADLMGQLRLDATTDADQLARLDQMIADAISHVAEETGLTLAPTDYELRLDCWPTSRRVPLPTSPIRGVDEVVYVDVDGVEQSVSSSSWRFLPARVGGDLWFAADFTGPELADWPGSVRIRFAAGFDEPGQTGSDTDPRLTFDGLLRNTIIMLAAAWFVNREAMPDEVEKALDRAMKLRRFFR